MKAAAVVLALNAVQRGLWKQFLESVAAQTLSLERKIVIDCFSDDATVVMAKSCGWECRTVKRTEFNHGRTRDSIVRELAEAGIDTVIFLSQDVILDTPDSLRKITDYLWNNPVAGCFGKQRTKREHSLNAWQRKICYPQESEIRTLKDVPERGMMAVFFSDAFAAWKTADVIRYGGFPETDFGEDTLLATKILNQGGATGYCAEAVVIHDHPDSPGALFLRGMQIGAFHRQHPELLRQLGKGKIVRPVPVPYFLLIPLGIKIMGYLCGRIGIIR